MKKITLVTTSLIIFNLLLLSCSKDSSSEDTATVVKTPFLTYKYNGTVYKTVPETITTLKRAILGQTGTNPNKSLVLNTPITVAVGSFPIVDKLADDNFEATYIDDVTTINGTGTIKITLSDSKFIEGTFEFSETENGVTSSITEGSFRASK